MKTAFLTLTLAPECFLELMWALDFTDDPSLMALSEAIEDIHQELDRLTFDYNIESPTYTYQVIVKEDEIQADLIRFFYNPDETFFYEHCNSSLPKTVYSDIRKALEAKKDCPADIVEEIMSGIKYRCYGDDPDEEAREDLAFRGYEYSQI